MRKDNAVNTLYPWVLGVLLVFFSLILKLTPSMKGYENILESIIQFSGLVIGFYTAMYGLVLVSGNSHLFKKFKRQGVDGIFKDNLIHSLGISFSAYIISVIMQELQYHSNLMIKIFNVPILWNQAGFILWIFIIGVFIGMSYRTIRLLLKLLFSQFEENGKIESTSSHETPKERKERFEKLR